MVEDSNTSLLYRYFKNVQILCELMADEIKPRHIKDLRIIAISDMTDEEIVKAALDRLKTRALLLVYDDGERWVFLGRYKKGGLQMLNVLKTA